MNKIKVTDPELQRLIDEAVKQGWDVRWTKNAHVLIMPRDKQFGPIFAAGSPSDFRGTRNIRSKLRQAGLNV